MNTELQIFKNEEFGEVRTIIINEEPYFVGKDVAEILGYTNTKDAISTHVDEEDKTIIQKSENATFEIPNRGLTMINESGLYSLILSSKMPEAKKFKRWVTNEVLPTIRKTGSYNQPMSMEDIMIYQLSETKRIKQRQIEQQHQLDTVTTQLDGMKDVIELQFYLFEVYRVSR